MATPPFQVKALYDYASKESDDLNFPTGQLITVTDVEDDDWYFGEYTDAAGTKTEGLFPKNFVKTFEPETPPRPSRTSRSKKELESLAPAKDIEQSSREPHVEASLPTSTLASAQPDPPATNTEVPQEPNTVSSKAVSQPAVPPPQVLGTKPAPPTATKPAPPPATEASVQGSFRDRINAFNKTTAPPVAPGKPSGLSSAAGSGFVKKPFVAPPPSKNAYIPPAREPPPQRLYSRGEDPEAAAQSAQDVEPQAQPQSQVTPSVTGERNEETEEVQPKPTSLKDRIALLQKQQMEQAARHAEAGQKKEKQKRPAKKQVESEEQTADGGDNMEGDKLERASSGDNRGKDSMELNRDQPQPGQRPYTRSQRSQETTPTGSPTAAPPREFLSDPNDADQSGIGETEEGEKSSTGRDESDEKPQRQASIPLPKPSQAPIQEADVGDEEDNAEEEASGDEEEDVDPEVKRRMEIRERMAKMSGGMGMAGMFGPPGGLPSRSSTKQASMSSERKSSANSTSGQADIPTSRAPPVPMMPIPGLQKVRSPEENEVEPEVDKEAADVPKPIGQGRDPEEVPDVEDLNEEPVHPTRRSTERAAPLAPPPQDRPVPAPPGHGRPPPPPVPVERPTQAPPIQSRPVPPQPASQPFSPSEGSESDDEMSLHTRSSLRLPPADDLQSVKQGDPPPLPPLAPPFAVPNRPAAPQSWSSEFGRSPETPKDFSPMSPTAQTASANRSSRVPPIPGSTNAVPSTTSQVRAPPPPPPTNIPPSRSPTAEFRPPPVPPGAHESHAERDQETSEYEGDYDTDMASSAPRKEALKSHARVPSMEDDSLTDEASFHHSGLPSIGPPSSGAPRNIPQPPPPNQPPKPSRQSSDMPRAAPPPPPPPKTQMYSHDDEEYDPYNYSRSGQRAPQGAQHDTASPVTPRIEMTDPMMASSPAQRTAPPPTTPSQPQYSASPNIPVPTGHGFGTGTRQSMDVQRTSTTIRRSTDTARPSGEHGFIAADVDLSQASQWWTRPNTPPPVFQNRRDLVFEIEEASTVRRGGKQVITKTVYVLFMDYSQTVVAAHFEAKEPANASLEQHHEAPPQNLRQDQLEDAHTRFGSRIAEWAATKEGSVVGDGSPNALVLDLLSSLPEALLPVGLRAYGALVYANLANASVKQFDEIRPGDIVTFRNTKFQGHRGAMHSKYSNDVGKPDHVGLVIDWDGTKKKVRAWEQGRESKKVKSESFKLGDMRSGEVKVWRVMARGWVGWEGQN